MNKKYVYSLILVLGLGVLAFVLFGNLAQAPLEKEPTKETLINLTESGFSPSAVTISRRTRVTWINKTSTAASINSSDHPTHQNFTPLNLGEFSQGERLQLLFEKPGTYTYHNHLNPTQTGSITVQ